MPHPAGWYPIPEKPGFVRYFDGNTYTGHEAPVAAPTHLHNSTDVSLATVKSSSTSALVAIIIGTVSLFFGVVWAVTFYISQGTLPIPSFDSWNLLISLVLFLGGAAAVAVGIASNALSKARAKRKG